MAENLNGIRKEYWNSESFRMILREALKFRPEHQPFNPSIGENADVQIEKWKARSAEQRGFDLAFKCITGNESGDFK